jgi:putative Holliday junction resolvase
MVILGIDVGTIRVGCAVAEGSVKVAFPLAVWPRAKNVAEREILRTIQERGASLLVVGLPLDPVGSRTAVCDSIEAFVRRIQKRSNIEVRYVDESFSSEEAKERARRSTTTMTEIDAFAACIIIDRFFECF